MDDARRQARRARLEADIGRSRAVQARVVWVLPAGVVGAVIAQLTWPFLTPFVLVTAAAYFGVGRYITAAHIADFRAELRELDRGPARPIAGREPDGG